MKEKNNMNIVTQKNEYMAIGDTKNIKQDNEVKGKVIRKSQLAREILAKGKDKVRIIDIKPDKADADRKRSVFVFEDTEDFQKIFSEILDGRKESKIDTLEKEIAELKQKLSEKERFYMDFIEIPVIENIKYKDVVLMPEE